MPDEVNTYSYAEDLKRYRKEKKRLRKAADKRSGNSYESRRYSRSDETFASRFNAGARLMGGDN